MRNNQKLKEGEVIYINKELTKEEMKVQQIITQRAKEEKNSQRRLR